MNVNMTGGVARANINPPVGILHANWGAQTHEIAQGIDMDLTATAVVLSDKNKEVALVAVDIIGIDDELFEETAKKISELANIDKENICIAASHTHSGPTIARLNRSWASKGVEAAKIYRSLLPEKIAGAVWEAKNNMIPVRINMGLGECAINVNRRFQVPKDAKNSDGKSWHGNRVIVGRNWKGFTDREVRVIRIDDVNEKPLAVIVNYAAHGTTMAFDNKKITPDYPGAMRKTVEDITGAACLFFQGAAGNQGTIHDFGADLNVYRRLGTVLGCEAAKVSLITSTASKKEKLKYIMESGADLAIYDEVALNDQENSLDVVNSSVNLPIKKVDASDSEGLNKRLDELEAELRIKMENGSKEDVRSIIKSIRRTHFALRKIELLSGKEALEVHIQGIRIGNTAVIAAPMEIFAEIGCEIKKSSPMKNTAVFGYANGSIGYLPTSESFEEGGYEIGVTSFAEGADRLFQKACIDVLEKLNKSKTTEYA